MAKVEAVIELIWCDRSDRRSMAMYKKIAKSCKALEFSDADTVEIMQFFGYIDEYGALYPQFAAIC